MLAYFLGLIKAMEKMSKIILNKKLENMKTLKLTLLGIFFLVTTSSIQAQVSVNVNIGSPPAWGPAGYSAVNYYYLPDVQAYYDIRDSQFIYFGGGKWVRSRYLPTRYRNYDLYNGYKVVLNDYHGRTPYVHFKDHKNKYFKGYKGKPQKTIGIRKVKVQKNSSYNKNNDHYNNKNRKESNHREKENKIHGKGKH